MKVLLATELHRSLLRKLNRFWIHLLLNFTIAIFLQRTKTRLISFLMIYIFYETKLTDVYKISKTGVKIWGFQHFWSKSNRKGKEENQKKEMDNVLKKIRFGIVFTIKYNKKKGEGSKSEGILPVNTNLQVQTSIDWKKII